MRRFLGTILLCAVVTAVAQDKPSAKSAAKSGSINNAIEARMDANWNAWCTMDRKNVEPFYDQSPDNIYFDLAPFEYKGFDAYFKGTYEAFKNATDCKATVSNKTVHRAGNLLWTTAHVDLSYKENGKPTSLKLRWTALWENKGGKWMNIHEHVSAPIA